jgi:uncharacterized damage-inducible protein DinB
MDFPIGLGCPVRCLIRVSLTNNDEKIFYKQQDTKMNMQSRFQELFSYHWDVNRRLIELSEKLSNGDYRQNPGYGNGSIHELLFHILRADQAWRFGIETGKINLSLAINNFPDLKSIKNGFDVEQKEWDRLLCKLTDDFIGASIDMTRMQGDKHSFVCWKILEHVVLHGMQHHAEISQLLTTKGYSPGNIDFIFYRNFIGAG